MPKDIILEESDNRGSDHIKKGSGYGPSTNYPANPLRTTFYVSDIVLARHPVSKDYKMGYICGVITIPDEKRIYRVKLSEHNGGEIIETTDVQ